VVADWKSNLPACAMGRPTPGLRPQQLWPGRSWRGADGSPTTTCCKAIFYWWLLIATALGGSLVTRRAHLGGTSTLLFCGGCPRPQARWWLTVRSQNAG